MRFLAEVLVILRLDKPLQHYGANLGMPPAPTATVAGIIAITVSVGHGSWFSDRVRTERQSTTSPFFANLLIDSPRDEALLCTSPEGFWSHGLGPPGRTSLKRGRTQEAEGS